MLKPLTNTTKKPYDPKINYDSTKAKTDPVADQAYNIACYNHDCRYSDPQGKTRAECDKLFLKDMKIAGVSFIKRWTTYLAVRAGGGASWDRCRENDRNKSGDTK